MPRTRRNTFRLLVLTLAVGLITLALVALACGPAAPGGQDVGTPDHPTSTPTETGGLPDEPPPTPTLTQLKQQYAPVLGNLIDEIAEYEAASGATFYLSNAGESDLASAVTWMASQGVKVFNFSSGFPWDGPAHGGLYSGSTAIHAVNRAVDNGIVREKAAGNRAESTWYSDDYAVESLGRVRFYGSQDCNWEPRLQPCPPAKRDGIFFEIRWDGN